MLSGVPRVPRFLPNAQLNDATAFSIAAGGLHETAVVRCRLSKGKFAFPAIVNFFSCFKIVWNP
jgi:hypothetical protein